MAIAFVAGAAMATTAGFFGGWCATPNDPTHHIAPDPHTSFSRDSHQPVIRNHDFIHPLASVIGGVELEDDVFVAPSASIRGDEGQPIFVGSHANVQDGVVIHALETERDGHPIPGRTVAVGGRDYAVYVGPRVSLAHQSQVHGPAAIGEGTFVGMQALVFNAKVGKSCVLEPRALVMGVEIGDRRYVPAGAVINTQALADALPPIDASYAYAHINDEVLDVNTELAETYEKEF